MSVLELNGRVFDASTTGTLTLTSESGAATTDVTQGLAKVFAHITQATPVINNSFNSSSHTDSGTGISDINFTNNQANVFFATTASLRNTGNYVHATVLASDGSTAKARAQSLINANTGEDSADIACVVHGDLA